MAHPMQVLWSLNSPDMFGVVPDVVEESVEASSTAVVV